MKKFALSLIAVLALWQVSASAKPVLILYNLSDDSQITDRIRLEFDQFLREFDLDIKVLSLEKTALGNEWLTSQGLSEGDEIVGVVIQNHGESTYIQYGMGEIDGSELAKKIVSGLPVGRLGAEVVVELFSCYSAGSCWIGQNLQDKVFEDLISAWSSHVDGISVVAFRQGTSLSVHSNGYWDTEIENKSARLESDPSFAFDMKALKSISGLTRRLFHNPERLERALANPMVRFFSWNGLLLDGFYKAVVSMVALGTLTSEVADLGLSAGFASAVALHFWASKNELLFRPYVRMRYWDKSGTGVVQGSVREILSQRLAKYKSCADRLTKN